MRSAFAIALASAVLLAESLFAADHLVGPVGSGAPYEKIQLAIDAAQPGDRVFVLPGTYHEGVAIDKPIELVGSGSQASFIRSIATQLPGLVPVPLSATGVPAGTRLRIAGFHVTAQGPFAFTPGIAPLVVHDTQGLVELADLTLSALGFPLLAAGTQIGALTLRDVQQVVIDGVQVLASGEPTFGPGAPLVNGMHGLLLERANVWINDSSFQGSGGGFAASFPTGSDPGEGGHGLLAIDSSAQLARVDARGGKAGGLSAASAFAGGAGLRAIGSSLRVHGGSDNRLEGASANVMVHFLGTNYGAAGPGAQLDASSALVRAQDALLIAGAASASSPASVELIAAPGAASSVLAQRQPSLAIAPRYTSIGAPLTVTYQGEPGSVHLRGIAIASAPALALPGIGTVLIDLTAPLLSPAAVLSAGGQAQQATSIPNFAGFAGAAFVEQSAQVTGLGISLAPPVVLTVGF